MLLAVIVPIIISAAYRRIEDGLFLGTRCDEAPAETATAMDGEEAAK
jgi:hypothetical protein